MMMIFLVVEIKIYNIDVKSDKSDSNYERREKKR